MELKPKSIKLVDFKEELLPSGRKLLHYIFEDKYGSRYSWTAPWKDKEGQYGVEQLFLRALEIEEWNDYEGVWSEELRKVSKEVPSLKEMELPVKIQVGEITEDEPEALNFYPCWRIRVDILSGSVSVKKHREQGKEYISIDKVNMSWELLKTELGEVEEIRLLSTGIEPILKPWGPEDRELMKAGIIVPLEIGISFWIWVEKAKAVDRGKYQIISKEIASHIRRFIRSRLSEYKAIKRGFEEELINSPAADLSV